MSAPSPVISMQTSQREFAGAKVQLFCDTCKLSDIFLYMSGKSSIFVPNLEIIDFNEIKKQINKIKVCQK